MTLHRLDPDLFHNTLGSHEPALRIAPGDTVIVQTLDAAGVDRAGVQRGSPPNPQSGPIWIDGAEPGDALEARIVRLTPARPAGWTASSLATNVVDPTRAAGLPPRTTIEWAIDLEAGTARPLAAPPALRGLTLPLAPMIGCLGVAPAGGEAISTASSGPHGGNMDWRGFRPGTTVWFPVGAPGARFFLGDGHALQGDGEIVGTGIEVAMEMEIRFDLRRGWPIRWPRGRTAAGDLFTVGNARPLDQALQHATTEMFDWLQTDYGLDAVSASLLLGQTVRYEIGNVYNPAYTVVCLLAESTVSERGA